MRLCDLFTYLTPSSSHLASASALGRSVESLTSDADLSSTHCLGSSADEESGAESFQLYSDQDIYLVRFYARHYDGKYHRDNQNNGFIISMVSVLFKDGERQEAGDGQDMNRHTAVYEPSRAGKIVNMTIYGGDSVDAISFKTDKDLKFRVGGNGGSPMEQNVGNGVLMGFKGTYGGGYVRTLEPIFQQ